MTYYFALKKSATKNAIPYPSSKVWLNLKKEISIFTASNFVLCYKNTFNESNYILILVGVEPVPIAVVFTLLFYIPSCLVTLLFKSSTYVYIPPNTNDIQKDISEWRFRGTDLHTYGQY